jgi:hypothetical protein
VCVCVCVCVCACVRGCVCLNNGMEENAYTRGSPVSKRAVCSSIRSIHAWGHDEWLCTHAQANVRAEPMWSSGGQSLTNHCCDIAVHLHAQFCVAFKLALAEWPHTDRHLERVISS